MLPVSYDERLELVAEPALLQTLELYSSTAHLARSVAVRTTGCVALADPSFADIISR